MNILQFRNVSYSYQQGQKTVSILNKVNVNFERGKFYSILGPSGSGKTTSIALASALDVPKEGQVLYAGVDIQKLGLSKFRRENVSIIFQSYNLITYMTALQNVVTAMEITNTNVNNKKPRALELLRRVGLTESEAKRNVMQLSGGQQQRVAIARALSTDANIIIADEPTGNLDENTAEDVIQLFQQLAHEENKCVIVVTHSNKLALESDIILNLKKGNLVTI